VVDIRFDSQITRHERDKNVYKGDSKMKSCAAARVLFACVIATITMSLHAMEYVTKDNVLTISGNVGGDDVAQLKTALTPAIKYLILKNPKGSDFQDALYAAGAVRDAKVTTVAQGPCGYACARMFLAGQQRMFSGDTNIENTFIELSARASYFDFSKTSDDSRNLKAVVSFPFGVWIKYAFPNTGAGNFSVGAILVFHPEGKKMNGIVGCGAEAKKKEDCVVLPELTALGTNVLTTTELFHIADAGAR